MKTQKSRLSRDRDLSRCDDHDDVLRSVDVDEQKGGVTSFQFIHRQIASVSKIDFSSGNWISAMASLYRSSRKEVEQSESLRLLTSRNTRLGTIRLGFRVS